MGDGQNDVPQHFLLPPGWRILREYDFFSEATNKLKQIHTLHMPQNPQALRQFFVPELINGDHQDETTPATSLQEDEESKGVLLFEKVLELSDVATEMFLILKTEKVMKFLSEKERKTLEDGGCLKVIVRTEKSESDNNLLLQKLDDGALALKDEWWRVMYYERFRSGDSVKGWGFRAEHEQLLFKLTATRLPRLPYRRITVSSSAS